MTGRLFGVGVGPGDPELMTLRAVKTIESCDVVAIPANDTDNCTAYSIAKQAVNNIENKVIISIDIPMTRDRIKLEEAYGTGVKKIEDKLREGKNVAFINLGDPTVYSTYMGIHESITSDGFEAEIINGVPSFCAVAAKLGISLAKSDESIHIYPAVYNNDDIFITKGTKVLMKSGKRLSDIKEIITGMERTGRIKSYAVTDCTMKSETICNKISELNENSGYFTTIIIKNVD